MDDYNEREIFCLSYNLLIKYGLYTFPIDIKSLLSTMDIKLKEVSGLSEDISVKRGFDKTILYMPSGDESTDRFNLTMGLGFIIMNFNSTREERAVMQAQAFALRLLLPSSVIMHNKLKTTDSIAKFFGVREYIARTALEKVTKSNLLLSDKLESEYYMRYCIYNDFKPIKFL